MNDLHRPGVFELQEADGESAFAATLRARFAQVRARSFNLARPLSEEDCCVQSMPEASPVKWHLAHTTWFFETFVLEKFEPDFRSFMPGFRVLFNSYYNGVGEQHTRAHRGMLTRPALHEVLLYRKKVNERMERVFERCGDDPLFCALVELGLNHEQQHQELLLTDVKHLLSLNPMQPSYRKFLEEPAGAMPPMQWLPLEAGVVEIGHAGQGFSFDNETPRHRHYLDGYRLASRLVSNAEYLQFIVNGGYHDSRLWLSEGWDWLQANRITHPLYWQSNEEGWSEFTLSGRQPLEVARPAVHLSYFEADAYARWAGARLPNEAEWEHAAQHLGHGDEAQRPDALHPYPAHGAGLLQMFNHAWQWTRTSYAPYPGYQWPQGVVGEYNGKFMVNQYVLRGSSCFTPGGHSRTTYRNFFPTSARWQMSGIRLAKDGLSA